MTSIQFKDHISPDFLIYSFSSEGVERQQTMIPNCEIHSTFCFFLGVSGTLKSHFFVLLDNQPVQFVRESRHAALSPGRGAGAFFSEKVCLRSAISMILSANFLNLWFAEYTYIYTCFPLVTEKTLRIMHTVVRTYVNGIRRWAKTRWLQ